MPRAAPSAAGGALEAVACPGLSLGAPAGGYCAPVLPRESGGASFPGGTALLAARACLPLATPAEPTLGSAEGVQARPDDTEQAKLEAEAWLKKKRWLEICASLAESATTRQKRRQDASDQVPKVIRAGLQRAELGQHKGSVR